VIPPFGVLLLVGTDEVELVKCPLKWLPDDKCSDTVWQPARVVN
jgi:hypothetical protein